MSENTAAAIVAARARLDAATGELNYLLSGRAPAPSTEAPDGTVRVGGKGPRSGHRHPRAGDFTLHGGRAVEYVYTPEAIRLLQAESWDVKFQEYSSPGGYARDYLVFDGESWMGERLYHAHLNGVVLSGRLHAAGDHPADTASTFYTKVLAHLRRVRKCPFLDITGECEDGIPVLAHYLAFLKKRARSTIQMVKARQTVPKPTMTVRAGQRVISPKMFRDLQEHGSFVQWGPAGERYPTPPVSVAAVETKRKARTRRTRRNRGKRKQTQTQQA